MPSGSRLHSRSLVVVNRWNYEILSIAKRQSSYSLREAITTAEKIPSNSPIYKLARKEIATWQRMLQPPLLFPGPESNSEQLIQTRSKP